MASNIGQGNVGQCPTYIKNKGECRVMPDYPYNVRRAGIARQNDDIY